MAFKPKAQENTSRVKANFTIWVERQETRETFPYTSALAITKNVSARQLSIHCRKADCRCTFYRFSGECSFDEIEKVVQAFQEARCDAIIGAGGGKHWIRRRGLLKL